MGGRAWGAVQCVCGSGQHLSVRAGGDGGRTSGWPRAANPVWTSDEPAGGGVDPGQQSASQGAGGAAQRPVAGPVSQSPAVAWHQRSGRSQQLLEAGISAGVKRAIYGGTRQSGGRASPGSWESARGVELGGGTGRATGLDGGLGECLVSN